MDSPTCMAGQDIRHPHRMSSVASHRGMRFVTYAKAVKTDVLLMSPSLKVLGTNNAGEI